MVTSKKLNLNFKNELGFLANPKHITKFYSKKLNTKELLKFHRKMLLIRKVELKIANLAKNKIINTPVHLSVGQEAIAVGISENLKKTDQVLGNHRSHSHILAKGTDLNYFFAECYGKSKGLSGGFGGSMHLIDNSIGFKGSVPIVGATIPIACGYALANKLQSNNNISVAFFGDGACEEGVFHETLNFASVYNLPILFVVENNLFSSHLDIGLRQSSNKISRFAKSNDIEALTLDGNNILEVYDKAKKIIEKIRKKSKPFLIEAITFRHLGHVGPNRDIDVGVKRNKKELFSWINNRDPLIKFQKYLLSKKIINKKILTNQENNIDEQINKAVKFSEKANYPKKILLKKLVYNEN